MVSKLIKKDKLILILTVVLATVFVVTSQHYLQKDFFVKIGKSEIESNTQMPPLHQKVSVLVFGDVMFDRAVRTYIENNSTYALFKNVVEDIDNADITVINLEGPITDNPSVVTKENLQFTFAKHTAEDLFLVGIDAVSLANNHTSNFGREGLIQTRNNLADAKVGFFGDPANAKNYLVKSFSTSGLKISFVGYNQFENPNIDEVKKTIQGEKEKGHFVVFFPHWGEEYDTVANEKEAAIAKEVINVGSDIIIGAHPHVVQNMDTYNDTPIFYSLGNFIFDQWFSRDVQNGLALQLNFYNGTLVTIELKPFFRERYQPVWLQGEEKRKWCQEYNQSDFDIVDGDSCLLNVIKNTN